MKKKTVITAGILGVLAVAAGVWFYHPAGKVDQEILSRLEGDYGIPYDGTIINLDADTMKLKIDDRMTDKDYYPSGWDIETSSDTIEFTYEETEDGLELTNHGKTFTFVKYQED